MDASTTVEFYVMNGKLGYCVCVTDRLRQSYEDPSLRRSAGVVHLRTYRIPEHRLTEAMDLCNSVHLRPCRDAAERTATIATLDALMREFL